MKRNFYPVFLMAFCFYAHNVSGNQLARVELNEIYSLHCRTPWNINEHLPTLQQLAKECSSVVEIGVDEMFSTWGILEGLSESQDQYRSYIGIDIAFPPLSKLEKAKVLAESQNISFEFWHGNDMTFDIPFSDMLFIDSLHTYCHLTYELEKFSCKVNKYIAMHDTSDPWGTRDDDAYHGDYSEYDGSVDKNKRGLWPAVVDFLERHPEWSLLERKFNNSGFTVLKRVE